MTEPNDFTAIENILSVFVTTKGGKGSGNFGHAGRPGKIGGSGEGDGSGKAESESMGADAPRQVQEERYFAPEEKVEMGKFLTDRMLTEGGFTFEPRSASSPADGYALSIFKDYETIIDATSPNPNDVANFIDKHQDLLKKNNQTHIGGWYDKESRKFFLDVSVVEHNYEKAIKLAQQHNQLAIWDLANSLEIRMEELKAVRETPDDPRFVRVEFNRDDTPDTIVEFIKSIDNKYH